MATHITARKLQVTLDSPTLRIYRVVFSAVGIDIRVGMTAKVWQSTDGFAGQGFTSLLRYIFKKVMTKKIKTQDKDFR